MPSDKPLKGDEQKAAVDLLTRWGRAGAPTPGEAAVKTGPRPFLSNDDLFAALRVNLWTQLERIIRRAGLQPWPKLFHNLRATRETELAESFPIHVVCAWIGNSSAIAAKHYLQVTEEHFGRAINGGAQIPTHQAPAVDRTASQVEDPET
jgi:hypothetical protein